MFEHHYDNMIKKNYTFSDINSLLVKNNFQLIYKSKMPFRKTFEYIKKKGPKKFHYHVDLEIINDLTPKVWLEKKL